MIRYDISQAQLERLVDSENATWRERAKERTEAFRKSRRYDNSEQPIWSEIKQVFIDLQKKKCAFCERPLESKKEYDVEHFRPKSSVKPWKVPPELTAAGIFRLDDRNKRRELFRGRADIIQKLGLAFRVRDTASTSELTRKRCQAIIDYHTSDGAPHTNCGRAFAKLWRANPTRAEKLWNKAVDFLATISPPRQRSHGGRSV